MDMKKKSIIRTLLERVLSDKDARIGEQESVGEESAFTQEEWEEQMELFLEEESLVDEEDAFTEELLKRDLESYEIDDYEEDYEDIGVDDYTSPYDSPYYDE